MLSGIQQQEDISTEQNLQEMNSLETLLKRCNILSEKETFNDMVTRVIDSVIDEEKKYDVQEKEIIDFKERMTKRLYGKQFVPSTTLLTNAGRYKDKPLAACSVPPISLRDDLNKIKAIVDQYHINGMGTGFNFDECDNPVEMLNYLNEVAIKGQYSGKQDRPVGNMGIISLNHPKIFEFIESKTKSKDKEWIFNISVNVPNEFVKVLFNNSVYTLSDGSFVDPNELLEKIVNSAWECGDPGLAFLDRFETDNPAPHLGKYVSLAPCGEIAMTEGETCQFTYLNVGAFVDKNRISYSELRRAIHDVVRFLDDALDISISNYGNDTSVDIMNKKRKIGLGICGFADMLAKLKIPYDSFDAEIIAEELMSFVNYTSKEASIELSKERGPFPAFYDTETKIGKGYIADRFGKYSTAMVTVRDWIELEETIAKTGIRHVSTTALPPTGRSSLVIDASPSIEPYFSDKLSTNMREVLYNQLEEYGYVKPAIEKILELKDQGDPILIPEEIRNIYLSQLDISADRQLAIVSAFQKFTDEAISKTVNINQYASPEDVKSIYVEAMKLGLKGITIYRDQSKMHQPIGLKK